MKSRKGNKDHLDMIKTKKPAIVKNDNSASRIHISDHPEKPKIKDWFNREPVRWSVFNTLNCPSYPNSREGEFINLKVNCGPLSYYCYLYMRDFKSHNELEERIKKEISNVQPVFNDYTLERESLKSANARLGLIKYDSIDKKKIKSKVDNDELGGGAIAFLSVIGFMIFCSIIGLVISAGG